MNISAFGIFDVNTPHKVPSNDINRKILNKSRVEGGWKHSRTPFDFLGIDSNARNREEYCDRYNDHISEHFLQKFSIHFSDLLLSHTFGSVKYFGFLIGVPNGSSVDFQWADGRHKKEGGLNLLWLFIPQNHLHD